MRETKKQMSEDMPMTACTNCNGRSACTLCGGYACSAEHHKYIILRWLLGLLILMMTFWLGAKVGEFKSLYMNNGLSGGYGNHFMMTRPYPNMMFSTGQLELATPAAPGLPTATSTAPTPKPTTPSKVK